MNKHTGFHNKEHYNPDCPECQKDKEQDGVLLINKEIKQAIWNGYRKLTESKGLDFDDIESREPDGEWDWSAYPERPVMGEPEVDYYNRCIAVAQLAKAREAVKGAGLTNNVDVKHIEKEYGFTWTQLINDGVDQDFANPSDAEQFLLDVIDEYQKAMKQAILKALGVNDES